MSIMLFSLKKLLKNTPMAGVIGVWSWPYPYGRDHRGMVPAIPLGPHYFVLQADLIAQWAVRGGVDPKFWKSFFWSQWLLEYPYQVILEYFDDQSTVSSIFLSSKLAKSAKKWKIGIFAMFGSIF